MREAEALRLHNRDEVRARGNASGLGDPREAQGRITVPAQADRSGYREVDHTGVR